MRSFLSLFLLLAVLACVVVAAEDADVLIADSKPAPVVGNNDPTTPIIQVQQKESSSGSSKENDILEVESLRDEGDSSAPVFSESELKRWPMKTLKEFITSKGLTCKGCSEKEDYVKMAFKNQHLPSVETQPSAPSEPLKKDPDVSREEIDELMEKLRRGGMGNSKFFSANDLQGLSPEELAEKINGKGSSPKKSKKPKSKSSAKSSQKDSTADEPSAKPEKKPKSSTKKDRSKGKDTTNGKEGSKESKDSEESDPKKEKTAGKRKSNSSKTKKSGKSQKQSSSHSSGSSGKPHSRVEEVMEEETIEL